MYEQISRQASRRFLDYKPAEQPGTLTQQFVAIGLWMAMPRSVRDANEREAWRACMKKSQVPGVTDRILRRAR